MDDISLPCFPLFAVVSSCPCRKFEVLYPHQQPDDPGIRGRREGHRWYPSKMHVNIMEFHLSHPHTLCKSSNPRPSSVNVYVLKNPDVHDRGDKNVSCAVPTTKCSSLLRAANDTTAIEKAASLLSSGITLTVLPSTGSMIRMAEDQVPAGALGLPNCSGGRSTISWSMDLPSERCKVA